MRMMLLAALGPWITAGCHSKVVVPIEPTVIQFPETYGGFFNSVEAKFTAGGKPISDFELEIQSDARKAFSLNTAPPLGGAPQILFGPSKGAEFSAQLKVRFDGNDYQVELKGTGLDTPICSPISACQVPQFDPVQKKCVQRPQPDGLSCAPPACDGASVCRSGSCVYQPDPNPIPFCAPKEPEADLSLSWKYTSRFSRGQIHFRGTTDSAGNIYFLDCEQRSDQLKHCAAVSLSPAGEERWRVDEACSFPYYLGDQTLPQLFIGNDTLIVGGTGEGRRVQALRTDTGLQVWEIDLPLVVAFARVDEHRIAALAGESGLLSVFRLSDGFIETRTPLGGPAGTLLGARTGMLFGIVGNSSGDVGSMKGPKLFSVLASGAEAWPARVPVQQSNALSAVSLAHLFMRNGRVARTSDGANLFEVPSASQVFDVVVPNDDHAVVMTDSTTSRCDQIVLQRIDLKDGRREWRCRLQLDDSTSALTFLHATADGGVVLGIDPGTGHSVIEVLNGDGTLAFAATLPMSLRTTRTFSAPAVVGNRWIVSGLLNAAGPMSIAAFDVPGLAPATRGWISYGGNPRRDVSPD